MKPCPWCGHAPVVAYEQGIKIVYCANDDCPVRYVEMTVEEWEGRSE